MAKIISSLYLNKKLTGDQLRSKVGSVRINGGNLGGASLKKFIAKLGGRTETQIEKTLKDKYGVSGYQLKKRKSIMELIRGDEKSGLTEEQIERNLKLNRRRDMPGLAGPGREMSFAGGLASKSVSAARTKGTMGDIGIKRGPTGFAKNLGGAKPPGGSAPQAPSGGTRPIGL